ncbi:MAG: FixH family protein [Rhodocyclaceae bacterium]|nr:FixH family protein [Rhodocyclaceae bacterium]MDZ4214669.1 FixH family protein [Rhodocyclaceae bacterium]
MTATSVMSKQPLNPWYREPWPWLLMAGPFIVIIAGLVTAWLAVTTSDGLVTDDYYQKGLAVAETLARSERAESLGVAAGVSLSREKMRVRLSGNEQFNPPPALRVMLSHPTRAGLDRILVLKSEGGVYSGEMLLPASGHWLVMIEDEAKDWRLMGSMMLPAANETVIGGGDSAKPQS